MRLLALYPCLEHKDKLKPIADNPVDLKSHQTHGFSFNFYIISSLSLYYNYKKERPL